MKLVGRKERAAKCFAYFLLFMLFCTLVSRGIYGMRLPGVTVEYPKRMNITHEITASGQVNSETKSAVWTKSGLRVERIYVEIGDYVEAGEALMQLDMDSVNQAAEEIANEIAKLNLQLEAVRENAKQEETARQTALARAQADYESTKAQAADAVTQAQNEVNAAQSALDALGSKKEFVEAAQKADSEFQKMLQSEDTMKSQLDEYRKKIQAAAEEEWEKTKEALRTAVAEKQQALAAANAAKEEAEVAGQRAIEDASTAGTKDTSGKVTEITRQEQEKELEEYQKLQENSGVIRTETPGRIESIGVEVGSLTPEGAGFIIQTAEEEVEFLAVITAEEKELVALEDSVRLTFGKDSIYEEGIIDSITEEKDENGATTGRYQIGIQLPTTAAAIGTSAIMTIQKTSESYAACIPLEALYTDGMVDFVYVLQEKSSILGTELSIKKQQVKILDKNTRYAALDASSGLSEDDQLAVSKGKELSPGQIVRLEDE